MPLSVILATVAFLAFSNAINHPFVHDDIIFILQNTQISHLDRLFEIFFQSNNNQTLPAGLNSYYRPFLELLNRLQYHFFGFNAACFHFVNVVVHIFNGLLLFSVLRFLKFSQRMAFGISLLFLIHPVQTEAVACVSGFSNLACTFFILLTLRGYLQERYVLASFCFILALLTKEQSVIVLPLIVLLDWYRGQKGRSIMWLSFAVLTFGFLWLRQAVSGSHLIQDILASPGEFYLRLLSIPNTVVMYLRLLILPNDLHYYRNTDILANCYPGFWVLAGGAVGLFIFIKKFIDTRKDILFGLGWFLICLLPVLNIVPLINEYSLILTAEHFLYLPMLGIVIILARILKSIVSPKMFLGLAVLIGIYLMGLTICQNTFWEGQIPLFERTVAYEKNFARGHILLAKSYYAEHQVEQAIIHYKRALGIMEGYEKKASNRKAKAFYLVYIKEIYSDLGTIYMQTLRFDQAMDIFNKILTITPKDESLLNNIAICYLFKGDKAQAEAFLKLALGFNPNFKPARDNLNKLLENN